MIAMRAFALASLSLSLIGCAVDASESDSEEMAVETSAQAWSTVSDPTYTAAPRAAQQNERAAVWTNGNDPLFFWKPSTQSALLALSQTAIVNANGQLASTTLTASVGGNRLLKYVVGCALPQGTTVSGPGGATWEGVIGIAPTWATGALSDTSTQRWMTACLVQTLNGLGAEVPFQLSGDNDALAESPDPDYRVLDATMFGNLFVAIGARAYACTNVSLLDACGIGLSLHTLQRICGLSPTCGLTLLGPCLLSCTSDGTCYAPFARAYPETVTSSVPPTIAISLNPLCQ